MTVEIGHVVGRFISSGDNDFRDPDMAQTPNACVIFANHVNTPTFIGGSRATAYQSIGFAYKRKGVVEQGVVSGRSVDNSANTDDESHYSFVGVVYFGLSGGAGNVVDFLPDNGSGAGIRINMTAPGADATFDIMLIHAEDAHVGLLRSPGSIGGTVATTTPGFSSDLMFFISTGSVNAGSTDSVLRFSFGAATHDLTQRVSAISEADGQAVGSPEFQERNDRVMMMMNLGTATVQTAMELTAVSATGLTLTQRTGTDVFDVVYLALKTAPSRVSIVDITSRTSVGTTAVTTGWKPQAFVMPVSMAEAFNNAYIDSRGGAIGFNLAVNLGTILPDGREINGYMTGITIEDAAATTNTFSVVSELSAPGNSLAAFNHIATQVAKMSYAVTLTGFVLTYTVAPVSALQWWAVAIEGPPLLPNPPIRRMYSLLHGLALSIVAKPSPLSELSGFQRDDLAFRLNSYDHEIAADGGYLNATITLSLSKDDAHEWLDGGVAKEITVYNEGQQICWLGLVNSVNASLGGVSLNSGNLLDVVNRIRLTYQTVRYDVIDYGGQERITEMTEDTNSQGFFGILEDIINGGTASDEEAAQLQSMFLAELAYLSPTQSINLLGGAADTQVTLDCIGYYELLDKALAADQVPSELPATDIMESVVGGTLSGLFDVLTDVEQNLIEVGLDTDHGRTKVSSIVKSVVAMGDVADNRWTAGSHLNRRFYYRPRPTSVGLVLHLSDSGFLLKDSLGAIVHPWDAMPGKWAVIPDLSLSRGLPGSLAELGDDRRSIFVERVKYSAPYGLELTGGRLSTINQRLAKQGLGGI